MVDAALPSDEPRVPGDDARDAVAVNVRRHRLAQGRSLRELAESSGTSKGLLSQLERGNANPTLDLLGRVAASLDLTINDLIRAPLLTPEVIRADPHSTDPADRVAIRTLFSTFDRRRIEMSEAILAPRSPSDRSAHGKGSIEYAYVVRGAVRVESDDWSVDVDEGDAVKFSAEAVHRYVSGPNGARVLTLVGFAVD